MTTRINFGMPLLYILLVCFGIVTISVLYTLIEIKTEVESKLICLAVCLGLSFEDLFLWWPTFNRVFCQLSNLAASFWRQNSFARTLGIDYNNHAVTIQATQDNGPAVKASSWFSQFGSLVRS